MIRGLPSPPQAAELQSHTDKSSAAERVVMEGRGKRKSQDEDHHYGRKDSPMGVRG